jgi:hypothetical protein
MKKIVSFSLLLISGHVHAQDIPIKRLPTEVFRTVKKDANDTTKWSLKRRGTMSLNLNQGSLSNWAAGGDNFSLSISSYVNYQVLFKEKRYYWDNNIDFNFGFVQSTSLGSRKNDDRIDILSKYGFNFNQRWYATALLNFRSQFFDGYTYAAKQETLSSTFLSPAYLIFSVGTDYKPNSNFSMFLSPVTSRWVIVASNRLSDKDQYGVPAGKHFINELGAFASVNYTQPVVKNVVYKGRTDLFTNYRNNPENVDLYVTNLLAFKINKYLSASYNLDLIYDDDVKLFGDTRDSPALQVKSLIGIGFSMRFAEIANP